MKDLISLSVRDKQMRLKDLIKNDGNFGKVSEFAIMKDLDYGSLCATVSGRQPNARCVKALCEEYSLTFDDFPRVPESIRKKLGSPEVKAKTNSED